MAPNALDVRRQEDESAVLDVEGVAVQVDELRAALVERRPHHLDDVRHRRHRLAVPGAPRTFHAEAAGGALHAEPARSRGMDQQVVPQHARDPTHGHPAGGAPAVEPRRRGHEHLEIRNPVATRIGQPVPAVGAAQLERRDRRAGRVDRHGDRSRVADDQLEALRQRLPGRREAVRARVDPHAARREVELDAGIDAASHARSPQAAQPSPARASPVNAPASRSKVERRPPAGRASRTRMTSPATSDASTRPAAGAST